MIGTIFDGRYLLISVVGKGGSSVVFNAYDRKMGCTVAIKMLDLSFYSYLISLHLLLFLLLL